MSVQVWLINITVGSTQQKAKKKKLRLPPTGKMPASGYFSLQNRDKTVHNLTTCTTVVSAAKPVFRKTHSDVPPGEVHWLIGWLTDHCNTTTVNGFTLNLDCGDVTSAE